MATTIHQPLSRTYKYQPYLPINDEHRKRKRSTSRVSFEVRPTKNGVGMFAISNISCGELIIDNEDPIVQCCSTLQHDKPNNNVCHTCATPIGTLRGSHLHAPNDLIFPYLEDDDHQGLVFTTSEISCQGCKEVVWCSNSCYQKSGLQHTLVCDSSTLKDFYDKQDNPNIFQLATKSITLVLSHIASLSQEEQTPVERFFWWKDYGSHPYWWEVGAFKDTKKSQAREFCNMLHETILHQKSVEIEEVFIHKLCTLENIGIILGMLQCNVMEYEYPSPTQQYMMCIEEILKQVHENKEESQDMNALKPGCDWLVKNILNKSTKINDQQQSNPAMSPIIGSGLYPLLTLANHDCNPNASIEFLQETNRGSMLATRDITIGEEICITYVPNGGVGNGERSDFFAHFEPTRTWKWLNANNTANDEDSDEHTLGSDEDESDDFSLDESAGEHTEEEYQPLEGTCQSERAYALLEYGFECRCIRCLNELRKD